MALAFAEKLQDCDVALLDVFPEFPLQQVGEDEQHAEHEQHADADASCGSPPPARRRRPGSSPGRAPWRRTRSTDCAPFETSVELVRLLASQRALALQRPQRVRHGDVRDTPRCSSRWRSSGRGRRCAGRCRASRRRASARSPTGRAARRRTRPCRPSASSGDLHRLADLLAGEQQVVLDLRLGQADVGQALVAHVLHAVAAEAVVDVGARAGLQADQVARIVRRAIEPVAAVDAASDAQRERTAGTKRSFFMPSPAPAPACTLSRAVYQGIRKKNRK